jgi:tetratricopeptide (TPR) repeat protein
MYVQKSEIEKKALQCLKKGKNKLSAQIALGIAAFEDGRVDQALAFYKKALLINAESPEANTGIGITFARSGDRKNALKYLQKAYKLNPNCGLLANWLADAYFDSGDLDRAVKYYQQAISLNNLDSNAHNDMADVFRLKGDYNKAIELYDKTLEIDPLDTNAMLEKAQCLLQIKNEEAALNIFDTLISKFPSSRDCATAVVIKATILLKQKKYSKALELLKMALDFYPFNKTVLFQAALCAFHLNEKEQTRAWLIKILEMTPDDRRARSLLAKVDEA